MRNHGSLWSQCRKCTWLHVQEGNNPLKLLLSSLTGNDLRDVWNWNLIGGSWVYSFWFAGALRALFFLKTLRLFYSKASGVYSKVSVFYVTASESSIRRLLGRFAGALRARSCLKTLRLFYSKASGVCSKVSVFYVTASGGVLFEGV